MWVFADHPPQCVLYKGIPVVKINESDVQIRNGATRLPTDSYEKECPRSKYGIVSVNFRQCGSLQMVTSVFI